MFLECEVFNRGEHGKLADLVRDRLHKGSPVFLQGKLHLEQWQDKQTGQNRSKHKLVVDIIQLLEPKEQSQSRPQEGYQAPSTPTEDYGVPRDETDQAPEDNGDIPF